MTLSIALVAVLLLAFAAGLFARRRAVGLRGGGARLNSLPNYHAFYVALWAALARAADAGDLGAGPDGPRRTVGLSSPAGQKLPDFDLARDTILTEAREIAAGEREAGFNPESSELAPIYAAATSRYAAIGGSIAIVFALLGAFLSMRRVGVDFRARTGVERWVMGLLVGASLIAILTTLGIVLSLLFEIAALLPAGSDHRIPVRHDLEPADRNPRRPGRIVGRLRLGPAVLGNRLHRRHHRDDRRHPAGADERDFPHAILPADSFVPG